MQRTIKLKTVLEYDQDLVWKAVTDSKLLGTWFMENDFEPVLGREFTFRMKPQKGWDGITHCQVLKIQPQAFLSYTYRGEATGEKALACAGVHSDAADKLTKGIFAKLDTILSFSLEPTCGGTILTMKQSGYKGLKFVLISYIMQMGWKKQLRIKLPKLLAQLSENK
ncbi:SRPBCC domain-containing protein [Soonwooa sp.]|uniref:SRPBCC family protein n=1 Tax=Soonwooa sp. TaxID=1938592 RepID=UPI0026293213|nr:SRPBCC domain-containing protein [Soonwooa sp.]